MDDEVRRRITRARAQLILHRPWFGYLATYLEPKEDKNLLIPTMGTDGRSLFYNPDFVRDLDMEQLLGCLAHEVFHAAFSHIWRRGAREPIRWNLAADVVANAHLLAEGFKLPSGGLMVNAPPKEIEEARKLSVEETYEKIKVEIVKSGGGGKDTISLPGEGEVALNGELLDDHDVWDRAGGEKGELEKSQAKKELEQRWREYVSRARQIVKSQGKGMGSLDEEIDELLEPKMNWRELLREFIISSVKSDYSLCPPNKRHLWRNIYLPSLKKTEEVEVAFVCDTSGSMSTEELRDALSELCGILEQFESYKVWFVECDCGIQGITELTPYSFEFPRKLRGRGGTEFPVNEIAKAIEEKGGTISALTYFTDGFGNVSGPQVMFPVIWLVCNKNDFMPPFGIVVKYEREAKS